MKRLPLEGKVTRDFPEPSYQSNLFGNGTSNLRRPYKTIWIIKREWAGIFWGVKKTIKKEEKKEEEREIEGENEK